MQCYMTVSTMLVGIQQAGGHVSSGFRAEQSEAADAATGSLAGHSFTAGREGGKSQLRLFC